MDFVRSYFGTNEPLTSWTLLFSLFFQISIDLDWSEVHLYRSNFLQNPYFRYTCRNTLTKSFSRLIIFTAKSLHIEINSSNLLKLLLIPVNSQMCHNSYDTNFSWELLLWTCKYGSLWHPISVLAEYYHVRKDKEHYVQKDTPRHILS